MVLIRNELGNYGPFSKSFSYTYYGSGLKHTFTAPDSTVYTYLYGLNNELQEIQIPGVGSMTIPAYTWNRPATITYPGGTQRSYTYDALMRLESLSVLDPNSTPLLDYAYTHDEVGNILTKVTEHGNYSYGYDAVSRLLTADNPVLADEAYTYDDVGNRLTSSDVTGTWSYNLNNELLGYEDVEYDYDENGNLTEIRIAGSVVWTYVYDAANRLIHVEDGTGTISVDYYYDPFGRRLWKEVGGVRTYFFYSEEGLIGEYDASGAEIRSYGYKPDSTWTTDPLWLKVGSTYYWYQNDHLGTPQKLVAGDGTVVWSAQYSAFGKADVQVETVINNLRFPGQFFDDETGLQYNYFRYYDPRIGRYLRPDPIGFDKRDVNLYRYTGNNPVKRTDPLGLWTISREGGSHAEAISDCDDTVEDLAKMIGMSALLYRKWLEPAYSFPRVMPITSNTPIGYQGRFLIPNIVVAYWAGNLSWFGRWHMSWHASISYLRKLGFQVIEGSHKYKRSRRLDDENGVLLDLMKKKALHGLYFVGHGGRYDGLYYGHKWVGPLFVGKITKYEEVLDYSQFQGDRPYPMALGLMFACFSNTGRNALVGSSRDGVIWKGYDWYFVPLWGGGSRESIEQYGGGTYHVQHWIRPGDQGTRINPL